MNAFTADLHRHLRAVLSLRVQAPLPEDIPVMLFAIGGGGQSPQGTSLPLALEIRTTAHPFAAYSYEEPGAWGKLLADLVAVSGGPTGGPTGGPS